MLEDGYRRVANYLRIGVTDRCNLRCKYCMPAEGIDFADRGDILSYEEIIRLAKIFSKLGVDKVRLTGGEPFVRKDIGQLIQALCEIFPKVHITTNATVLNKHFDLLKTHKIELNISIDSLDRERFFMITRRDEFEKVMQNIDTCILNKIPIKLNIVVMKGVNDMEIIDFINFGITKDVEVRFIEAMPFNEGDGNKQVFMSAPEIRTIVHNDFPAIKELDQKLGSSAQSFELENGYKFSIIPAYSRSLCGSCNRIRMTAKGEFLTCLYSKTGTDLLSLVRDSNMDDNDIAKAILKSVGKKKKDGFEEEALRGEAVFRSMTTIGG